MEIPTINISGHYMTSKQYKDKDWLYSQYVEKRLTRKDIASLCGMKERTIKKWLEIYDIKKFDDALYKSRDWLYKNYVIQKKSAWNIAKELGCSPTTIKKWLNKYEIPIRTNSESLKFWYEKGNHPSNWQGGSKIRICVFCGESFEVERARLNVGYGRFCSNRCSTAHRRKTGSVVGVVRAPDVERFCIMCGKKMILRPTEIKRGRRFCSMRCFLRYKGPTDIEIIMKEWLEEADVDYIEQYLIKMLSAKTIVDFYLPEKKICLYCDDEYWHNRPKVIIRDEKQNVELPEMGYEIIRVGGADIRNGVRTSLGCLVGVV